MYDFVEKLDLIEPPGQLISLLTDPLLQKYVELKSSPIIAARTNLWLGTCLEEQYEGERVGNGDSQYFSEILGGLAKFSRTSKVDIPYESYNLCMTNMAQSTHPIVLAFLEEYLKIWSGQENTDAILELLSRISIMPFTEVYHSHLAPVESAMCSRGAYASAQLLDFYTSLLQHQISTVSAGDTTNHKALRHLVAHVGTLSTSMLLSLTAPTSTLLASSVLSFYELLSSSCGSSPNQLPAIPILLPPTHLVYLLAQEASITINSRVCGILGAYKIAFDQHPKPVRKYYAPNVTDMFNICMRDNYNLLWVSKALTVAPQKSLGMFCAPELRAKLHDYLIAVDREYGIEKAFVLSNNPWLASLTATVWRMIEMAEIEKEGYDKETITYHNGPVSKATLEALKLQGGVAIEWDGPTGYKVMVLRWLGDRGLDGIKDLMFAIAVNLRGRV